MGKVDKNRRKNRLTDKEKLKQLLSKKKLIILDIDDTLIKSCPAIIQHHIDTAKKMDIRVPAKKEILLEAMDYAEFLPILPEFIEIDLSIISKEIDLAFLGNQSAGEACKRMKEGIDKLLRESEAN